MRQVAREAVAGLLDDAALFPPRSASMKEAVTGHRAHLASWYGELVGPFVLPDRRLDELCRQLGAEGDASFRVSVILTDGPGALPSVLLDGTAGGSLELAGLEIPLGPSEGALRDAREAVRLLADLPGVKGYAEVPAGESPEAVLDVLASSGAGAKLRTGGTRPSSFPSDVGVARFIVGCAERGLPFKCTAGLHAAVRHREPEQGVERQGFANIVLATDAALSGAPVEEVACQLGERDEKAVVSALASLDPERLRRARSQFCSFGTCSVEEPVEDLVRLGLLERPARV